MTPWLLSFLFVGYALGFGWRDTGCPYGRDGYPECREPYYLKPGEVREPGTLLLNMLIKDEEDHLRRTLPQWAKIIDYWIIGVDDHNTDSSPQVIEEILGHLPGEIVYVPFDGMGPTWSILVNVSIDKYPKATHGLLADADFSPMVNRLDKYELDIRCSKHMYTIWTEDHLNERKMDWVYRNIPGAVVRRRTHQILNVPPLENQEVFQTMLKLPIEERTGGYQDRSGKKNERYIGFLEADLRDWGADDTRTLYYLGYAHYDIFNKAAVRDQQSWEELAKGVDYFKRRVAVDSEEGNAEERWFSLLKLGEIHERYYQDWNKAEEYYKTCSESDPERADSYFYIGQHYRLMDDIDVALPYLRTAALMPSPDRSLFHWHYLYNCLATLEYSRALGALGDKLTVQQAKEGRKILGSVNCEENSDPGVHREIGTLMSVFDATAVTVPKGKDPKQYFLVKLMKFLVKNLSLFELSLGKASAEFGEELWEVWDDDSDTPRPVTRYSTLLHHLQGMHHFLKRARKGEATCADYRAAIAPYFRFREQNQDVLETKLGSRKLMDRWQRLDASVSHTCR